MSTNNFRWSVTFAVKKNYTKQFLEWMEKNHIPKIHATGFFEKGLGKRFEEKKEGEYDVVQYVHTPLSKEAWESYNEGPRSALREEFTDEWGGATETEDLQVIGLTGELELIEIQE